MLSATLVHWFVMTHLEELLERIAVALEKIAGDSVKVEAIRGKDETPFPWGDPRIDTRTSNPLNWKSRRWSREGGEKYGPSIKPETFEQFIKLGRSVLRSGRAGTRNLGQVSIDKLDPIFHENGFGDAWMSS